MKRVFIYGKSVAAVRPSAIAGFYLSRPREYCVILATPMPEIWGWLGSILAIPMALYSVFLSDVVVILPMSATTRVCRFVMLLASILKRAVILDFYISNYETYVLDKCMYPVGSLEAKRMLNLDKRSVDLASAVVFLNKAEQAYYTRVCGFDTVAQKAHVIPLVSQHNASALLPGLTGAHPYITFCWWGIEGNPLHGFSEIAKAAKILVSDCPNIRFALFASGGKHWDRFRDENQDLFDVDNILISKDYTFSNGRLREFISKNADVALGTFGSTSKAKTVLVNKVVDAASFGLPCITQRSAGLSEYFEENVNIILADASGESLVAVIKSLLANPDFLLSVGKSAKRLVEDRLSLAEFERRWALIPGNQ